MVKPKQVEENKNDNPPKTLGVLDKFFQKYNVTSDAKQEQKPPTTSTVSNAISASSNENKPTKIKEEADKKNAKQSKKKFEKMFFYVFIK